MSDVAEPDRARNRNVIRKPSRWRWAWRTAGSVCVTLLIYFAWQLGAREWTKQESERELAAALAAAERDDPDWTWERLNAARPHPPDDKNGAELIPRIKDLTHPDWGKTKADPQWKSALEAEPNRQFPPKLLAAIRRELTASADAVALARTMKDRPWGRRDIVLQPDVLNTRLQDTQDTRHVAELLRWDAAVAVGDGGAQRASENLLALLNTSRSIGDEPMLISQLVRIAVRAITLRSAERVIGHRTNATGLSELQAALAADAEEPLLLFGARGDRAVFDRLFENLANGITTPGRGIDAGFDGTQARLGWWHYRPNLLSDRAYALAWMTWCVDAARLPIQDQPAVFASLVIPPNEPNRMLSRVLLPAVDKVAAAHWRSTADARCAVSGLACERFRQTHGRWPGSLADLVPAFLPAVPLDPFSGKPLGYAKPDGGALVFSVGQSGLDDEGELDGPEPPGSKRCRFRLWNPDQRRLPPPEPPAPEQDP